MLVVNRSSGIFVITSLQVLIQTMLVVNLIILTATPCHNHVLIQTMLVVNFGIGISSVPQTLVLIQTMLVVNYSNLAMFPVL